MVAKRKLDRKCKRATTKDFQDKNNMYVTGGF